MHTQEELSALFPPGLSMLKMHARDTQMDFIHHKAFNVRH